MIFITEDICGVYDLSFRPDAFGGAMATSFAEGKRFCGSQIIKMSKIALGKFSAEPREQG